MPSFDDAPDGSSSVNHTGSTFSEDSRVFWEDIDPWAEIHPYPPTETPYPEGVTRWPAPPHPSYADGSASAVNPLPNLNTAIGASHVAANPNRRIEARMFSQGEAPFPANAGETVYAVNPEWGSAAYQAAAPENRSSPPRRPRRGRVFSDPDAAIRKDPNAWSLREAVELCKLLEVVLPEAGFHIALTGGLLHKEGRQARCDLVFYQIRGAEPNYEVLWKYLTVAGVIRSPSYPENGWLVKATYRGKAIDCLFPNAKKAKKAEGTPKCGYNFSPPLPYDPAELLATPAPAPIPPAAEAQDDIPF